MLSCVLLSVATVSHLARGLDALQCVLGIGLLVVLVVKRDAFVAVTDHPARRSGVLLLLGGAIATVLLTTASVEAFLAIDRDGRHLLPFHMAVLGVAERMVGVQTVTFPGRLNEFLSPTLLGVGLALAVFAVLVLTRPLVDRRQRASASSYDEARRVLDAHGGGTLDYFALRYDKAHHFSGETLITYAVHGGVCVVAPDPIGPDAERAEAWAEFLRFADSHGWLVAVLGADESWLPVYRAGGMRPCTSATRRSSRRRLRPGRRPQEGPPPGRQPDRQLRLHGRRSTTRATSTPRRCGQLEELMTESRRGDVERGFSMTLGRMFDPDDAGLLLGRGTRTRDGDAGRRSASTSRPPRSAATRSTSCAGTRASTERAHRLPHRRTIEHLRERGCAALGLNFAAMRAVLAGEAGDLRRSRRSALRSSPAVGARCRSSRCGASTPSSTPTGCRRYLVYGSVEHLLTVGLAVARAESIWELPVIGRFLYPGRRSLLGRVLREHERQAA